MPSRYTGRVCQSDLLAARANFKEELEELRKSLRVLRSPTPSPTPTASVTEQDNLTNATRRLYWQELDSATANPRRLTRRQRARFLQASFGTQVYLTWDQAPQPTRF